MSGTEFSELFAVDVCLGNHILNAFKGMASDGPGEWKEFLTRSDNKKVIRHEADDSASFLKDYMADALNAQVETAGHRVNQPPLPICWYCRVPGFVSNDEAVGGIYNRLRTLWTDDQLSAAQVRILGVILTYKLGFIARDKPALDKLALAWFSFVSNTIGRNHKFTIPYSISTTVDEEPATIPVEMPAEIRDPKSVSFEPEPVQENGKIFAVSTTIEIDAPVVFGEAITIAEPIIIQYAGDAWHGA